MGKVMLWSARHAKLVVAVIVAVSLVAAFLAVKVRIDSSTEGMMIEGDPAKAYHRETVERFGSDNVTVVFVRDKRLFTPEKLKILESLYYDLKDLPGVERAESLFSVTNFKGVAGPSRRTPSWTAPPTPRKRPTGSRPTPCARPCSSTASCRRTAR